MPRILGGFAGLIVGIFLYAGAVMPAIAAFFGLTSVPWVTVAAFTVLITTIFAYIIAVIAQLPTLAAPAAAAALPPIPVEGFMSGYISGLSAVVNFALWPLSPFGVLGPTTGFVVAVVGFLSVFSILSRNLIFQAILGWTNWLRPYSYLATSVGILLFLVNLPFAIAAFGPGAIRLDGLTGTIETTGGIVGVTGFRGGFNLGNFTFLSPGPGVGLAIQSLFGAAGISAHETGHTLTVASFGGVFHWINAIDENVPPLRRLTLAYGELIPESHFPRGLPFRHVRIWS
jgi:hypothetical protein